MNAWRRLSDELDQWHAQGRVATLWWRDDDAVTATPALERLLHVHRHSGVPLALACIPARVASELTAALEPYPRVAVLQHGYAHTNHAGKGERAIELAGSRPGEQVVAELERGWERLRLLFPASLLPVLVPPWNRIAAELIPIVRELGYRALSCFAQRTCREAVPGLAQSNCHADPVDWRGTRGFRGEASTLDQICAHLEARRSGAADADEATGILTHHLVHDESTWNFLEMLFERSSRHPGARWLIPSEACPIQ